MRESVRFASTEVVWIENRAVYTNEHKEELWYTRNDFYRFKDGCKKIMEWLSNRRCFDPTFEPDIDDATHCTRGLEKWTKDGSARYLDRRNHLIGEIYNSTAKGISPNQLAVLARSLTDQSKTEAEERGLKDEKVAMLCHDFGLLDQDRPSPRMLKKPQEQSICRDPNSEMDRFLIEDCSSWCINPKALGVF